MLSKKRKGLVRDVRQLTDSSVQCRVEQLYSANPTQTAAKKAVEEKKRRSDGRPKERPNLQPDTERLMKATTKAVVIIHWDMNSSS